MNSGFKDHFIVQKFPPSTVVVSAVFLLFILLTLYSKLTLVKCICYQEVTMKNTKGFIKSQLFQHLLILY